MNEAAPLTFYAQPTDPSAFYQGDIVLDVPFFSVPAKPVVARPPQRQRRFTPRDCVNAHLASFYQLGDAFASGVEAFVLVGQRHPVLVVSQTCDIQHRSHVLVAPVRRAAEVEQPDLRDNIMQNGVNYYFALPDAPELGDCFADMSKILAVRLTMLRLERRVATLSAEARQVLQLHLSTFLTRPFEQ